MHGILAGTLATLLVPGALVVGAGNAAAASSAVYYYDTWKTGPTYRQPTATVSRAGWLYAGNNYFYCQLDTNAEYTDSGYRNHWWAKTDDDTGNAGVWISDVYISAGDNDEPVPGLPSC